MSEIKWVLLTDNYGRSEADIIKSYLGAQDIKVEFFWQTFLKCPTRQILYKYSSPIFNWNGRRNYCAPLVGRSIPTMNEQETRGVNG